MHGVGGLGLGLGLGLDTVIRFGDNKGEKRFWAYSGCCVPSLDGWMDGWMNGCSGKYKQPVQVREFVRFIPSYKIRAKEYINRSLVVVGG